MTANKMGYETGNGNSSASLKQNLYPIPFDEASAPCSNADSDALDNTRYFLPAAFRHQASPSGRESLRVLDVTRFDSVHTFLQSEFDVSRLNKVFKHLWTAGLPRIARPLHQQCFKGRKIVVTERADCHLLWQDDTLSLKPLPRCLMYHSIWKEYICQDWQLFEDANGFLLSYLWLICYESDLKLAHDHGLLPKAVTWHVWMTWVESILQNTSYDNFENVSPRYFYGELRLSRVNMMYRFCHATTSFRTLVRGYEHGYTTYSSFVQRNTTWFFAVIIYITIVLTAMQVGLATEQLQNNWALNEACYVFTIFAIVAPLLVVLIFCVLLIFLVLFNLRHALYADRRAKQHFPAILNDRTFKIYQTE